MTTEKRIALSTAGSKEEALRIAQALVERRLAACVNIVGEIRSIYRWKGKVEAASEWLLIIKTSEEKAGELAGAIRSMHSYDTPELIVLGIDSGDENYLNWIGESVSG